MRLLPPISTRTATLFPYTTLFRSLLLKTDDVRHSDKVRQGPGAHLAHDRSTVNFDGNLTDSKVAGYLFVQLSHRDQLHYLLLARRQRLKPLPHLPNIAVEGALLPVAFYGCQHGIEHILIIERSEEQTYELQSQ